MIDVPFIPKHEIESRASAILSEFWPDRYPVNPKTIWDNKMGYHFDTLPDLLATADIEALLVLDQSTIVLDADAYAAGGHGRLHFSIAHEIGHFVLHHSHLISALGTNYVSYIADTNIWKLELKECSSFAYSRIEKQADIFAAYFLMPGDKVIEVADGYFPYLVGKEHTMKRTWSEEEFVTYLSSILAEKFEVSNQSMGIRISELDLYERYKTYSKRFPPRE